jgi:NAD(P)-dependent dehydrogenase (short-subunit alcohol dehydrogenase family)
MEITGQAAIISGGASGLGRATAKALAAAGVKVTILDINEAAAAETAREMGAFAIKADVTDAGSIETAFAAARERHGSVRIAVNCAGVGTAGRIVGRDGPLPLEAFRRVIEINLIGSFNVMRIAATEMSNLDPLEDGERGIIISTASVAAYEGQIGQAAYSASKGGIVSLTLPAARELARYGVRVVAIAPGIFATPMLEGLPPNIQESLAASVPFPHRLRAGAPPMSQPDDQRGGDPPRWRAAHGAALTPTPASRLRERRAGDQGRGGRRSRSGAISSIACASLISRSLSPSTSCVDSTISTRL